MSDAADSPEDGTADSPVGEETAETPEADETAEPLAGEGSTEAPAGSGSVLDREVLLDVSVNLIPMFILLFFVVVFLAFSPFGEAPGNDAVLSLLVVGLHAVPFVGLAILTYLSAKQIERPKVRTAGERAEEE